MATPLEKTCTLVRSCRYFQNALRELATTDLNNGLERTDGGMVYYTPDIPCQGPDRCPVLVFQSQLPGKGVKTFVVGDSYSKCP